MLTNLGFTVLLILDHKSIPTFNKIEHFELNNETKAIANYFYSSKTQFNLSWRKDFTTKGNGEESWLLENEIFIATLYLNDVFIGDLNWNSNHLNWPSISGTFDGLPVREGEGRFRLEIIQQFPSPLLPSTNNSIEEDLIDVVRSKSILFDIIIKQNVQELFPNPNSYFDINLKDSHKATSKSYNKNQTSSSSSISGKALTNKKVRNNPVNFNPTSTRYHPYTKPSLPTTSTNPSQTTPLQSTSAFGGNFDKEMEEKLKKFEIEMEEIKVELGNEKGNVLFFQNASEKLYNKLSSEELILYLSERLNNEILSPDMRITIAKAKQEAIILSKLINRNLILNEVGRICSFFP